MFFLLVDQLKRFLESEIPFISASIIPSYLSKNARKMYKMVNSEMTSETQNKSSDEKQQREVAVEISSGNVSIRNFFTDKIFKLMQHNIIAVVGPAGSGKTSLMKTMLQQSSFLQEFEFIFFVQCDEIDFSVKTNLMQLLSITLPYQWICDQVVCLNVVKELSRNDKVLIIIDGYDRGHTAKMTDDSLVVSLEMQATANSFIEAILSRQILSLAKVVVTARTHCFFGLPRHLRNYPTIQILGLRFEAQNEICRSICADDNKSVLKFIRFYPSLSTFCETPKFCAAVIHVVNAFEQHNDVSNQPEFLPFTRVAIAVWALLARSNNSRLEEDHLQKLSYLAWQQVIDGLRELRDDDILDLCAFDSIATLINVCVFRRGKDVHCVKKFHDLWLEVLAAFHCVFFMDIQSFCDLFKDTEQNFNKAVTIHVFGLCEKVTRWYVKKLLPTCKFASEKLQLLEEYVKNLIKIPENKFSSFFLCSLAHVTQDEALASKCASQFGELVEVGSEISQPSDLMGLCYALRQRKDNLSLFILADAGFVRRNSQYLLQLSQFSKAKITWAQVVLDKKT